MVKWFNPSRFGIFLCAKPAMTPGTHVGNFVFACILVCARTYNMHGLSVKYVLTDNVGNKN